MVDIFQIKQSIEVKDIDTISYSDSVTLHIAYSFLDMGRNSRKHSAAGW